LKANTKIVNSQAM